jgi:hypothetical protein
MDRQIQLIHLAEAERHIALARDHVDRQEEIVAEFDRRGFATGLARSLLSTFQASLLLHEQHRALILAELAANLPVATPHLFIRSRPM